MTEHKVRLFAGDLERLQALFPALGAGPAIRQLVRNFIQRVEVSSTPLDLNLPVDDLEELLND
jgi:hypothetical protein